MLHSAREIAPPRSATRRFPCRPRAVERLPGLACGFPFKLAVAVSRKGMVCRADRRCRRRRRHACGRGRTSSRARRQGIGQLGRGERGVCPAGLHRSPQAAASPRHGGQRQGAERARGHLCQGCRRYPGLSRGVALVPQGGRARQRGCREQPRLHVRHGRGRSPRRGGSRALVPQGGRARRCGGREQPGHQVRDRSGRAQERRERALMAPSLAWTGRAPTPPPCDVPAGYGRRRGARPRAPSLPRCAGP